MFIRLLMSIEPLEKLGFNNPTMLPINYNGLYFAEGFISKELARKAFLKLKLSYSEVKWIAVDGFHLFINNGVPDKFPDLHKSSRIFDDPKKCNTRYLIRTDELMGFIKAYISPEEFDNHDYDMEPIYDDSSLLTDFLKKIIKGEAYESN